MRKTVLCLMIIMLLLAFAACRLTDEEQLCPPGAETASQEMITAFDPDAEPVDLPAAEPAEPEQRPEDLYPENIDIQLFRNGENREGYSAVTDEQKEIVMNAVFNYMLKSAAWDGLDIDSTDMYIHIYTQYAAGRTAEFYVFDKDGQHCMQAGKDGMYSTISDEVYKPLYELAMGWHTPHTMTVKSGGKSVFAVRNWVWSERKDGLCADGMRLTPQQAAAEIEYITLAEDFTPYIDGKQQPGIVFKLYDENFDEVEYPIPSGLAAWTYIGRVGPGRYIAVTECGFEDENGTSGYQYFFGLIVPD